MEPFNSLGLLLKWSLKVKQRQEEKMGSEMTDYFMGSWNLAWAWQKLRKYEEIGI